MILDALAPVPRGPGLVGLVLAAGAGRRMGTPKALLAAPDGTPRALAAARGLRGGGCDEVLVVLGAAAEAAERLLASHATPEDGITTVVAASWGKGMGSSLRAGVRRLGAAPEAVTAVLVTLVDLPDVGTAVHRRVVDRWLAEGGRRDALLRATYGGRPGHPVLLGRAHWSSLAGELSGDTGAQRYLARHTVREVSCDDLATGRDVDRPEDLPVSAADGPEGR